MSPRVLLNKRIKISIQKKNWESGFDDLVSRETNLKLHTILRVADGFDCIKVRPSAPESKPTSINISAQCN